MNTIDPAADPTKLIGLIELPQLAELLTVCGMNVITGPDFRTSAAAIRDAFKVNGTFPLVTADMDPTGLRIWLRNLVNNHNVQVTVVRNGPAILDDIDGITEVSLPFTVDQLLSTAGIQLLGGPAGSQQFPIPAVAAAPVPAPTAFDFPEPAFDEDPAPRRSRRSAPSAEDPFAGEPAPVPAPVVQSADPFGAPLPSRRAQRQQEQVEIPVQQAAPAEPVQQAPLSRRAMREMASPVVANDEFYNQQAAQPAPAQATAPAPEPIAYDAPPAQFTQQAQFQAPEQYAQPVPSQPFAEEQEFNFQVAEPAAPAAPTFQTYAEPAPVFTEQAPAPFIDEEPFAFGVGQGADEQEFPSYEAPVFEAPQQFAQEPVQYQQAAQQFPGYQEPQPFPSYAEPSFVQEPVQYQQPEQVFPGYQEPQPFAQEPVQQVAQPFPPAPVQYQQPEQVFPGYQEPQPFAQEPVQQVAQQFPPAPVQYQGYTDQAQQFPGAPQQYAPQQGFTGYPAPQQQGYPGYGGQQFNHPAAAPFQGFPTGPDASGVFDTQEAAKYRGTGRTAAGLGSFIINYSGKGGVGKSTTSLQLARMASAYGLRVTLIDGNSGQGDLRTYLRLNRTDLPTIFDAAISPHVGAAFLDPETINSHREPSLDKIEFSFVAAPPDDINDPMQITHELYRRVITHARQNSDLVIMDTQIIESADRTGVVRELILPDLIEDAFGVGVADMTNVGVNNLNNRLRKFLREGVPADRMMTLMNKVAPEQMDLADKAPKFFEGRGTYLGHIPLDAGIAQDMNAGRIEVSNRDMSKIIATILLRVTGNEAFRPEAEWVPEEPVKGKKGRPTSNSDSGDRKTGLMGRLFGAKKQNAA